MFLQQLRASKTPCANSNTFLLWRLPPSPRLYEKAAYLTKDHSVSLMGMSSSSFLPWEDLMFIRVVLHLERDCNKINSFFVGSSKTRGQPRCLYPLPTSCLLETGDQNMVHLGLFLSILGACAGAAIPMSDTGATSQCRRGLNLDCLASITLEQNKCQVGAKCYQIRIIEIYTHFALR